MAFSFSEYLHLFQFLLLKLGTSNVPQVRHKMTPAVGSAFGSILCSIDSLILLSESDIVCSHELVRRRNAIRTLRAFQEKLSPFSYLVKNGDI